MRNINQITIAADEALEPVIGLKVRWRSGSGSRTYASKTVGGWDGRILEFGGLNYQKQNDDVGTVASVSITLSDHDGHLKWIVDNVDIEGTPVTLQHVFAGAAGSASDILYGRISGPIDWSEGNRTLKFDVVSEIESDAIGYATTEGQFTALNDVAVDEPWPMVFGWAMSVKALLVQETPHAILDDPISLAYASKAEGFGSTRANIWKLEELEGAGIQNIVTNIELVMKSLDLGELDDNINSFQLGLMRLKTNSSTLPGAATEEDTKEIEVEVDGVIFKGKPELLPITGLAAFRVTEANVPKWKDVVCGERPKDDDDYLNPKVLWLADDVIDMANHFVWGSYDSIKTFRKKPGVITNTVENICVRQEGRKCWFKYPFKYAEWAGTILASGEPDLYESDPTAAGCLTEDSIIAEVRAIARNGLIIEIEEFVAGVKDKLKQRRKTMKDTKNPYGVLQEELELIQYIKNAFWSAPEGSRVTQWNPVNGDIYIVNLYASQEVNGVTGIRTLDGKDVVTKIPAHMFEVNLARQSNGPTDPVTTIEFKRPLESFKLQGWKREEIYVTVRSTIAPDGNTADIVKHLFDTYTNLIPESSSFTAVSGYLTEYPSHFSVAVRDDALAFAKKICWQARCGLVVDGEQVKIRYLSKVPNNDYTLNESKTEFRTIELSQSPIDDILTELVGTYRENGDFPDWVDDYQYNKEQKVRFNHNVSKYGHRERVESFFIYKHRAMVWKSLFFWGHRYANSYRQLKATTFVDAMELEIFDTVRVNYASGVVNPTGHDAVVIGYAHDVHRPSIVLDLWTPVLAGTTAVYEYAWLSDAGDEAPPNFAEQEELSHVSVHYYNNKAKDLDEVMRELRKLEQRTKLLGKVTGSSATDADKLLVKVYGDGPHENPTGEMVAWAVNPWEDIRPGDFVLIETGQDGVNYIDRMPENAVFGEVVDIVNGVSTRDPETGRNIDGYWYHVKLIDLQGGSPLLTDTHTFPAEPYRPLKDDGTGEDETKEVFVRAANFAEHAFPTTTRGHLPVGSRILLQHGTLTDSPQDFWFFFRDPNLTNFAFLTCGWLDLKFQRFDPEDVESEINYDEPPLLMHRVKVANVDEPTQAIVYAGCGDNRITLPLNVELDGTKLRFWPVCTSFDDAGHLNFDETGMLNVLPDEQCGEPLEVDLAGAADKLVAATFGGIPGYLDEVLKTIDPWISMTFFDDVMGVPAFFELEHTDAQAIDGINKVYCLVTVSLGINEISFDEGNYSFDEKGHRNSNGASTGTPKIVGDGTWIEIADETVPAGDMIAAFNHIGPDVADPAFDWPVLSALTVTPVTAEETDKGTHVQITSGNYEHDQRGHGLQGSVSDEAFYDVYVPQMLKHLKDVSGSLAPATGDVLVFDGTNWVAAALENVVVITDFQVDGATLKLEKKTRSITVFASGPESAWLEVHTGVECPVGS